jgi:KDO2-lipid IV(A) lauroyltransferase
LLRWQERLAQTLFAHLPRSLAGAQRLGWVLGWLWWLASPRYRADLAGTLATAGMTNPRLHRQAIGACGVQIVEALWVWQQPWPDVLDTVREVVGWEAVEAARGRGGGLLFLTPHLGCFEITSLWAGERLPITILYRPPRQPWLAKWLTAGRARGGVTLAPAELRGVRQLVAALRRGEAVGLLPDQTPKAGEGVWAPFFGHPAWTMTLAARLSLIDRVTTVMVWGERLPHGTGFRLHFWPLLWSAAEEPLPERVAAINRAVEATICLAPDQYLWGYPRFKRPAGVPQPAQGG